MTKQLIQLDLVVAGQQGDAASENRLFELLSARLLHAAKLSVYKLYPKREQSEREAKAEDLVQEALITIRDKYKSMKFDSGFFSWTNQILRNTIGNDLKKEKRRGETFVRLHAREFPFHGSNERIDEDYDYRELVENIKANIAKLSDICKKILSLFFNDGSRSDVIDLFPGKSTGYIDNKIFRCRQKLKDLLRANGYVL